MRWDFFIVISGNDETESRHQTHRVEGASFEEAAFEFVDRWHPEGTETGDVAVIVTDCVTGEQHCFRLDLETGEAGACD